MDIDWYMSRPDFADRTQYPTADDVHAAVRSFQDLARRAQASGSCCEAERFRLIAEWARLEYQHRTNEAYRTLLPQLGVHDLPCAGPPADPSDQPPPPPGSARG